MKRQQPLRAEWPLEAAELGLRSQVMDEVCGSVRQ